MRINKFLLKTTAFFLIVGYLSSCGSENKETYNFDDINNRIWPGEEFWTIPIEDWRVNEGRIECVGERENMRFNFLTTEIEGEGSFDISVQMGVLEKGEGQGSAGLRIAIQDDTDSDYRSLCYFGQGMDIGIRNGKEFFLSDEYLELPVEFDLASFILRVNGVQNREEKKITAEVIDTRGNSVKLEKLEFDNLDGIVSLVNDNSSSGSAQAASKYWFDNISISGDNVMKYPERTFGPVLWSMYTLSKGTLKMTAQMPPLSSLDPQTVLLQMKNGENWIDLDVADIDANARIAVFRVENFIDTMDHNYRLVYELDGEDHYYEGIVRKNPDDGELSMGGLTCQYHYGFPYSPLLNNLTELNPDMLYFSGDQIYEQNGGYGIIRFPADAAIVNYLGKWYMFGWAFGDLMKDRPTIVIPDDHEVYQGNLWGEGGKSLTREEWEADADAISGFIEPAEMVNVVMHTNCGHLPDPYDPEPMKQGIDVYYTDVLYGGVSFGIVGDRIFKSGPENIATWEGRNDHIKTPVSDPSTLDDEDLKLLGERQLVFLDHWVQDWTGSQMKILLSQTIFANAATHHGNNKMFLHGDMDSGGWPKTARDRALKTFRKAFAFHIAGDQHLPSMIQYGIDEYRDAGWAFCTPAIAVGYPRRFLPDELGWDMKDRPEHGNPNTGKFTDIFGNPTYVYAVGNPVENPWDQNRYVLADNKSSGFGLITFNNKERKIKSEAYRFLADLSEGPEENQFPGWPVTVDQLDNFGEEPFGYLPVLKFNNARNPVIRVFNTEKAELIYSLRIKGNEFAPFVFEPGEYTILYQLEDGGEWNSLDNLTITSNPSDTFNID